MATINMSATKKKKKSEIPTVEDVIAPSIIDAAYAKKIALDNAEATFKADATAIKERGAAHLGTTPGSANFPGTEVMAQITIKRDSLNVVDVDTAKEIAGVRFARYVDEQVVGVLYAVSAQNRAKVATILQAAGMDPGLLTETIQAQYTVREQYLADLADGTIDALFGDKAAALKKCIEVGRTGGASLKFVAAKGD